MSKPKKFSMTALSRQLPLRLILCRMPLLFSICWYCLCWYCQPWSELYRIRYNSDRGTQYTSESYRQTIREHHIHQSMNSAGGRCHDNARCESMWARMKTELLYDRYDTKQMTVEELKVLIWRYFLSYWNNRRICSANGGLPPMIKRRQYYETLELAA